MGGVPQATKYFLDRMEKQANLLETKMAALQSRFEKPTWKPSETHAPQGNATNRAKSVDGYYVPKEEDSYGGKSHILLLVGFPRKMTSHDLNEDSKALITPLCPTGTIFEVKAKGGTRNATLIF